LRGILILTVRNVLAAGAAVDAFDAAGLALAPVPPTFLAARVCAHVGEPRDFAATNRSPLEMRGRALVG
jgi:hypothetical protein